jgi:hypothetical protein
MHTQTLKTVLRAWAGPARDRLTCNAPGHRAPWIIACWETAGGRITVTVLEGATAALHARLEGDESGSAEEALGAGWLEAAVAFDARMGDLAWCGTQYLAGIGLLTREQAWTGHSVMRVHIATGAGGAVVYERHDGGAEANMRLDTAGPLWWDADGVLIPLERYRALVTGRRPHLPAYAACEATAAAAPVLAWRGPC